MQIPFYKQETNFTCGVAAFRMVLASFGIKKTEKQLLKALRTTFNKHGTLHKELVRVAEEYKFVYVVGRNSTIATIKQLLEQQYRIILGYFMEQENCSHYAVVRKITSQKICLLDPWLGPETSYSLTSFKKQWYDGEGEKGWFIAIKRSFNN